MTTPLTRTATREAIHRALVDAGTAGDFREIARAAYAELDATRARLAEAEAAARVIEDWTGLHRWVEIAYYVDHYEIVFTDEDGAVVARTVRGDTVTDALALLAPERPA